MAAEAYAAATAFAVTGDELYKQREYEPAKAQFELGLQGLQAIESAIPETMDQQLELARQAIEEGDIEGARAALAMAELIEPENANLSAMQNRAGALEELLPLLQQAVEAFGNRNRRFGGLPKATAALDLPRSHAMP